MDSKTARTGPEGRYIELNSKFRLRPLRSEAELDQAIEMVNSLIDRDELDPEERDYLDVLADQIERYENEHHPIPAASDAEMLRYLIDAKGITQTALASETSIAESTISAILSGKRGLSRNHISKLSGYFKVAPSVFLSVQG